MQNLLKELWYGNIKFQCRTIGLTDEEKRLAKQRNDCYEALEPELSKRQIDLLDQYDAATAAQYAAFERDAFMEGVKFATGYLLEALSFDKR